MQVYGYLFVYLCYFVESALAGCPQNEEWDTCKSPCEPTCQNPNPFPCYFIMCNPGCVCKLGYIRDEFTKKCVKRHLCPVECRENEIENTLNSCEPTCPSITQIRPFVVQIKQCICKKDLVRHNNGSCVPLESCDDICEKNEEISDCANPTCRKTCQNLGEIPTCAPICIKGCVCKEGYIWDEDRGECVLESDCPAECGENEVYKQCKDIPCRITCKNYGKTLICPKICIPGCSCKPGFIWDEQQNKCVRRSQCVKVCGVNEVWSYCINSCAETCQHRGKRMFTLECKSGCICREGYLWDEYMQKCVTKRQCSKVCDENQEFGNHIAEDLPTCQSLFRPLLPYRYAPSFVPLRPGCACKSGFIIDEQTNKCISLDDCLNGKHTTTTTEKSTRIMTSTTPIRMTTTVSTTNPAVITTSTAKTTTNTEAKFTSTAITESEIMTTIPFNRTTETYN